MAKKSVKKKAKKPIAKRVTVKKPKKAVRPRKTRSAGSTVGLDRDLRDEVKDRPAARVAPSRFEGSRPIVTSNFGRGS